MFHVLLNYIYVYKLQRHDMLQGEITILAQNLVAIFGRRNTAAVTSDGFSQTTTHTHTIHFSN